jgi:hypothetical protein
MTETSSANFELAIVLPLGVAANQLLKVEADLRLLNAKTTRHPARRESAGLESQLAARLEKINETLETIRALVADIEADLQPNAASPATRPPREDRDD